MTPERWEQVKELFLAAMEREPQNRSRFLDEACGQDSALRAEVASLLSQHDQGGSFLAQPVLGAAVTMLNQAYDNGIKSTPFLTGLQLGGYRILNLLGTGGMGEVYRATDTKLGRDVAIKVLPRAFARDAERLARFRREAKLLASLNHSNIATIHGFEQSDDLHYLVLELAHGETLAERLSAGPLGVKEALSIGGQIAQALEAAHEKGIIHRDLKPANIKVTPGGTVKVLDFGLAKAFAGEVTGKDPSDSPSVTEAGTREGLILGTPPYMSPEQARGRQLDKRTDIWSFGCVLYEMLTGRQAFKGETASDTIAAILVRELHWGGLPENTPPSIRLLLRQCLEKDSHRRLHDIADARIQIEEVLASSSATWPTGAEAVRVRTRWRWVLLWALSCLATGALAGIVAWNLKSPSPSVTPPVARLKMTLPSAEQLMGLGVPAVALSPDGTRLAYSASRGGRSQLYLRALDQMEGRPIPGTEYGFSPFFSPDGRWLGFFAGAKLKKVSTSGGTPITLCDAPNLRGASWVRNDSIIFAPTGFSGLWQVSASGGKPEVVTTLDSTKGEGSHRWPELLPDGKTVLFTAGAGGSIWGDAQIVAQSLETATRRVLVQGGTHARYVPTGHLVYAREGKLLAVPFDLARLEVTGPPVPIVEDVLQSLNGAAQFSFSSQGWLVYLTGGVERVENRLVWVDRKGTVEPLALSPRAYAHPHLSTDGRRLAITIEGMTNNVWIYDIPRDTLTRLTFEASNATPLWTPDGRRVTFQSTRAGRRNLFWRLADGSGAEERLTTSEHIHDPASWSPGARMLVFTEFHPVTLSDIWVLSLDGERKSQPFLRTQFQEAMAVLSPDGGWLAYISNESGQTQIYVRPFPGPGGKIQISTDGGTEPVWARSGRELFYRHGERLMAVDVVTHPALAVEKPKLLFEGRYENAHAIRPNYDVTPDGRRFLMIKGSEQEAQQTELNVVVEWFEDLKRLAQTKGKE